MSGSDVIAESLLQLGVSHMFGIVGIPIIEVAESCIAKGIKFISFRNEQAATYAASIYGYLTGKPGVVLVVGGPGAIHALAGVENSHANNFPLLLLAGSCETYQREKGAFQELDQVSLMKPFTKLSAQPTSLSVVPDLLEKAYRTAYFGRPGATYLDLPADIIQAKVPSNSVGHNSSVIHYKSNPGPAPKTLGDPDRIKRVALVLNSAKSPLLIVGKGAAYGRAENTVRQLHSLLHIPFLPTPMGKGVLPDSDDLNMSAARSAALKNADVILLLGGRLNWILHYGEFPKFDPSVKIIQVDIAAEELGNNAGNPYYGIVGDIGLVCGQLVTELSALKYKAPAVKPLLVANKHKNQSKAEGLESLDRPGPMIYQGVYKVIRDTLQKANNRKVIYVSEGANTMDISRSSFSLEEPRTRLDAGTNATMGVGLGYAIAAKIAEPDSLVVAIEGDSAFGFSAMEVETAVRSNLPMIIYVMNNSGVYHGVHPSAYDNIEAKPLPSTALQRNTAYHTFAQSLGARGFLVTDFRELEMATERAIKSDRVCIINVIIDLGENKKLEFGWMASTKAKM